MFDWKSLNFSLFFLCAAIVLVGLPTSIALMSIGSIGLAAVWLLEWSRQIVQEKDNFGIWRKFFTNKPALLLCGIFLLHVVGILWSENLEFGLRDLRTKLPLFFMPIVFASGPQFDRKHLFILLWLFSGAVVVTGSVALYNMGENQAAFLKIRDIMPFVSHVRYGLLLAMALVFQFAFFWAFRKQKKALFSLPFIAFFCFLIWKLQSATGFVVLAGCATMYGVRLFWLVKNFRYKWLVAGAIAMGLIGAALYIWQSAAQYYEVDQALYQDLDLQTAQGNPYVHHLDNTLVQNNRYVFFYIAEEEMCAAWSTRSTIPCDSLDQQGNMLVGTLIRYLTSLGPKKDAEAVSKLSDQDIVNIENGFASFDFDSQRGLDRKLNEIFFEIDNQRNGGNPSGNSLIQRLEFWKTGAYIFEKNWIFGVGTGDTADSFAQAYKDLESPLREGFRLRAHNQYLTIALTFGVFGWLFFVFALIWPGYKLGRLGHPLYLPFLTIVLLSFLTEDTLETQAGVTFFAVFSGILLFYKRSKS